LKYISEDVEEAAEEFQFDNKDSIDYEEWASETFVKAKKFVFTGFKEGEDISEEYIKTA
jgi:hypothetical protein